MVLGVSTMIVPAASVVRNSTTWRRRQLGAVLGASDGSLRACRLAQHPIENGEPTARYSELQRFGKRRVVSTADRTADAAAAASVPSICGEHLQTDIGDRHPDNGDPPRAGARRSRLNGRESVAHEAVQHRVRKAVSEHVRHSAAVWGTSKQAERPALVSACCHRLSTPSGRYRDD